MQRDFHFYNIYMLCRSAGVLDKAAQIIAYASQYTDDAKSEGVFSFQNGGRYGQVMTAHRFLDLGALSKHTSYNIFLPFHFLPGNNQNSEEFYEKLVCKANSDIAQQMMTEVLSNQHKPYFLQRLGIALHTYADTWAHQGFSGVLREENMLYDLEDEEKENGRKDQFDENWMQITSSLIPAIGHGKAGNFPDIPYKKWRYRNNKGELVLVENQERFLEASYYIFHLLCSLTGSHRENNWMKLEQRLIKAFQWKGTLGERVKSWKIWLKDGAFYFKKENLDYNENTWFDEALEVVDRKANILYRKPNFYHSSWKHFHDAAMIQRFYILNEMLPQYDIYCA